MSEKERGPNPGLVEPAARDPWRNNELARRHRIREAAARPLGENLAQTLALSEFVIQLAESMRRTR
jgi:hypothetical protein